MKKHLIICSLIVLSTILISAYRLNTVKDTIKPGIQITETVYILKPYNGKLAIYKNSSSVPYKVYNIQIDTLPKTDIELLKNGISVKSEQELNKLIADYTS